MNKQIKKLILSAADISHAFLTITSVKVKLVTVVEGDQKAPFPVATTSRCRRGRYSFPWIAPLYPRYVPYIAKCYQVPFLKSLV